MARPSGCHLAAGLRSARSRTNCDVTHTYPAALRGPEVSHQAIDPLDTYTRVSKETMFWRIGSCCKQVPGTPPSIHTKSTSTNRSSVGSSLSSRRRQLLAGRSHTRVTGLLDTSVKPKVDASGQSRPWFRSGISISRSLCSNRVLVRRIDIALT